MPRHYVICYDIGDHRRLARVHRTLAAQAMALQYSVFLFQGSATALQDCLQQLEGLLDLSQDDVRAYPLPARGLRLLLGRRLLPEGVLWSGLPTLDGMPHTDQPDG
ncbi:CRISPR-associated endonuclease Cas2 [Vandammella animalimorsus]|uniref:CRISPR-associated endoribonuclease Cas2 n=1 Tax=Vandammella animalimorsus TaxID=2029117 RepID=A0A2A2AYB8_9BURK|nr:CRISPR-associated endonuclease Cas2 [Vandammella animalimorsus]PAT42649.1 CRISPR-associated endonuclease Cas2 [Vandammella animalimorsus]